MAFLDDLKDRLGFGVEEEEEFDEDFYGEGFDEHAEEFDNYSNYDDTAYAAEEQGYSAFTPISTRSSTSRGRQRLGAGRSSTSSPQLVSIEDVRNSTRIPESLQRDPLPPRRGDNNGRNSMGRASDFSLSGSESGPRSAPEAAVGESRSAGYNSLFAESDTPTSKPASEVGVGTHPSAAGTGYDPYRAYEAGGASSHRPTRSISVVIPVAYNEVENVARMLRAGDAVVLSLRNTPNQLSKRILDFSFGVASALDATVDCIADKVFAITRVSNLNDDELARLRSQGVI